jgi:hypothetical protein
MTNQKQTDKEARRVAEGGEADHQSQRQGDNRTPNKTIGQVEYADNEGGGEQKNRRGSTTTEKQGGIDGR